MTPVTILIVSLYAKLSHVADFIISVYYYVLYINSGCCHRVLFVDAPKQKKTTYCEDCIDNGRFAADQLAREGKMSIRTGAKESGILSSRLQKRLKLHLIHAPKLGRKK